MGPVKGGRYILRGDARPVGTEVVVAGRRTSKVSIELETEQMAQSVSDVLRNLHEEPHPTPDAAEATDIAAALLPYLDAELLLDDAAAPAGRRGIDAILALEDQANRLLEDTVYRNPYWQAMLSEDPVPDALLIGTTIENYHLLVREPLFDSPALWYPPNAAVRQLFNEFFASEFGHDQLLLAALHGAGLDTERLVREGIPLAATTSFCNALSYWAVSDPLFFFATIGFLEGREGKFDSFITACERSKLPASFVDPIRRHAMINVRGGHGSLGRVMFRHIAFVDETTYARLARQLPLFIEIYDRFYQALWQHYTRGTDWLRLLSDIELDA